MFRNLIFDWSGTLCDDLALTLEATNYVFSRYGCEALDVEAFRAEFQLPYPEYYAWKIPNATMEELEGYYRYAFDRAASSIRLLPHARAFMDFCRSRGIRCFVLTSMDSNAFDQQVREQGLFDYFEHIHSGIRNKEHYIPSLMAQHNLVPAETAFIGDMQHDIYAAHCAGITSIGVLTGYNNAEQLSVAKPQLTVPTLAELQSLMERFPARQKECISLNGLQFSCHIGVPDEERASAQLLSADITITPKRAFSEMEDDITATICYATLTEALIAKAQEEPTKLIESLAHKLARCCVEDFAAQSAEVTLYKQILPQMKSSSVTTSYP